jgi:hypothetical protein
MPHIVLTEEQARALEGASEPVEIHDPHGRVVAVVRPLDAVERKALEIVRQRRKSESPQPGIPQSRVAALLARLNELDQAGQATPEAVEDMLRRIRQAEAL